MQFIAHEKVCLVNIALFLLQSYATKHMCRYLYRHIIYACQFLYSLSINYFALTHWLFILATAHRTTFLKRRNSKISSLVFNNMEHIFLGNIISGSKALDFNKKKKLIVIYRSTILFLSFNLLFVFFFKNSIYIQHRALICTSFG